MIVNQRRTFFVTAVAFHRQSYLRRVAPAELFLETLFHYRDRQIFRLHEFVVMEDHVPLILTPSAKFSLEKAMQRIKGGFSFQVGRHVCRKMDVWQPSFTQHLIVDVEDFERHRDYVLDNPVRAGLVRRREAWPLSSVHRYFRMDALPEYLRG